MYKINTIRILILSLSILIFSTSYASNNLPAVNSDLIDIVNLRDNCTNVTNCSDTVEELLDWVWGTRAPSITNPLLVDIGPGIFLVQRADKNYINFCKDGGNVTFKGSGVDITILTGVGGPPLVTGLPSYVLTDAIVKIKDCDNLTFQDLSIQTRAEPVTIGGGIIGVGWVGGGKSVWNNVRIKSDYWSWIDICSASGATGEHKWFGSSLESGGGGAVNSVYRSDCANNILHGSELFTFRRSSGDNSLLSTFVAVEANGSNTKIQLYGSSVRALYPDNASAIPYVTSQITGLKANDGGVIHMHGGIISVRSEHPSKFFDVVGAQTSNAGFIHTPETAYGLKAGGTGVVKRLVNDNGTINSPFQWPTSDTPPVIQSINGYDTFTETDCDSSGDCSGNSRKALHPHTMIYDDTCNTNGPWFDSTINACRK